MECLKLCIANKLGTYCFNHCGKVLLARSFAETRCRLKLDNTFDGPTFRHVITEYNMAYTNRTCNKCGFRNSQPNMRQEEIEYVSGSSQAGLSARAVVGSTLGSKKSAKQVTNWASGNTKRQYKRKRLVWVCANGCNNASKSLKQGEEQRSAYVPQTDKERLRSNLEHHEYMFGELFLLVKDFDEFKNKMGNISDLTDAEARKYYTEMNVIMRSIQGHAVRSGYVYKDDFYSSGEKFFRFLKKMMNWIMWGLGTTLLVALFFF
jgi:hypothetical protein